MSQRSAFSGSKYEWNGLSAVRVCVFFLNPPTYLNILQMEDVIFLKTTLFIATFPSPCGVEVDKRLQHLEIFLYSVAFRECGCTYHTHKVQFRLQHSRSLYYPSIHYALQKTFTSMIWIFWPSDFEHAQNHFWVLDDCYMQKVPVFHSFKNQEVLCRRCLWFGVDGSWLCKNRLGLTCTTLHPSSSFRGYGCNNITYFVS